MVQAFTPFLKNSEFTSSGNQITDSVFGLDSLGVAGTNLNEVDAGAFKNLVQPATSIINQAKEKEEEVETKKNLIDLSAIDQAKLIAEGAYAGQTGSEPDWGVASLLYFSKRIPICRYTG